MPPNGDGKEMEGMRCFIFSWEVVASLTPVASPFLHIHYFPYYFFLGDGGGGTFEKRGISPCISGP